MLRLRFGIELGLAQVCQIPHDTWLLASASYSHRLPFHKDPRIRVRVRIFAMADLCDGGPLRWRIGTINNPVTECVLPNIQSAALLKQLMSMSSTSNSIVSRVANCPKFFGTVPNSDAVSRVPNGSVRDRLMSRIFTEQKSNEKNDPYFRFFAFDLCLWVHLIMNRAILASWCPVTVRALV